MLADALAAFAQTQVCGCLSSLASVALLLQPAQPQTSSSPTAAGPAALFAHLTASLEPVCPFSTTTVHMTVMLNFSMQNKKTTVGLFWLPP